MYEKCGFRLTAVVSGVMLTGAYFSPLVIGDPYVFAAACSLGIGYGSGGCFYMCFLESWKHFPTTWRGKLMGLIAAVYGFAPIIWNSLFTFLCNPENRPANIQLHVGETEYNLFGAEVADRVNWVSAVLGLSMLGCYVVAIAGFPMNDAVPAVSSEDLISAENKPPEGLCPDLNTAVKTWAFWSMLINMFCGITYGLFIVNAYKNYGLTKYSNDQLMSSIGSIAAVFGGISRVLFSSAMDHFSFRLVFGLNVSLQLAATAGITYALETSLALYCICVSIGFSTLAGVFPAFIMESSRLFGHK